MASVYELYIDLYIYIYIYIYNILLFSIGLLEIRYLIAMPGMWINPKLNALLLQMPPTDQGFMDATTIPLSPTADLLVI